MFMMYYIKVYITRTINIVIFDLVFSLLVIECNIRPKEFHNYSYNFAVEQVSLHGIEKSS